MALAVAVTDVEQESVRHQAVQGLHTEPQKERLRNVLSAAVDIYITIRPAMQNTLERCNTELAAVHLEIELLTLKKRQDSLEYEVNRYRRALCRGLVNEKFDTLVKMSEVRDSIHPLEGTTRGDDRQWAVEIVRRLLLREAEAPFGLPAVNLSELHRQRADVLRRLMEPDQN